MTHNDTFSSIWGLQDKSNSRADIRLQQAYFVKGTCQAAHAGGKVGAPQNVSLPLSWVKESLAASRLYK